MTQSVFRERLVPGPVAWILCGVLVGSLAVAYGAAIGMWAGIAVGATTGAIALALIWITSLRVGVDSTSLHVGRATLPRHFIGQVTALDETQTKAARDRDARAFLSLRPLSCKRAVLIEVRDDTDPHPYWLVSSRHPERLAASLGPRQQEDR